MTDDVKPQSDVIDFTFDLAKVSAEELLDILCMVDMDQKDFSKSDYGRILRSVRKCLVKSEGVNLTGADVNMIIEQFFVFVNSGGARSKN